MDPKIENGSICATFWRLSRQEPEFPFCIRSTTSIGMCRFARHLGVDKCVAGSWRRRSVRCVSCCSSCSTRFSMNANVKRHVCGPWPCKRAIIAHRKHTTSIVHTDATRAPMSPNNTYPTPSQEQQRKQIPSKTQIETSRRQKRKHLLNRDAHTHTHNTHGHAQTTHKKRHSPNKTVPSNQQRK